MDYGCGPTRALAEIFRERNHPVVVYDPYFAPYDHHLAGSYDFITCSETVEHFYYPGDEFERLDRMLLAGGWLGIMTQLQENDAAFASWHYVRDPTHVCFYHRQSMEWIAEKHRWHLEFPRKTVILFRKSPA